MLKMLGSLLLVSLCACYSTARHAPVVEPADPIVGDLHCVHARLTIIEALYGGPDGSSGPTVCEAR